MGQYVGGEGTSDFNVSLLGSVVTSHDLPIEINDSRSGPSVQDREAVATWLRKWADGIEEIG